MHQFVYVIIPFMRLIGKSMNLTVNFMHLIVKSKNFIVNLVYLVLVLTF